MSLKSIELQLAFLKTQELGKIQNNLHQQTPLNQSLLLSQIRKEEIQKRKRIEKTEKNSLSEENTIKQPKPKDHLKGKYIDITL